jgi:formiminoglutamase
MKILCFDPKSSCIDGDSSRLGMNTQMVKLDELEQKPHGIVIFGMPDDAAIRNVGGRPGAKEGPNAARLRFYKSTVGAPKYPLYELGNLEPLHDIASTHRAGADVIRRIHHAGHTPLILGGGHDLAFAEALALLEAKAGKQLGFLNIDAHLDLRPVANGITSGSPWFLLREQAAFQKTKSRIEEFGIQRHCNSHALVEYADRHGIRIQWLDEIRNPIADFRKTLTSLSRLHALQVSLDIDSVRSSEAPGCSAPQVLGFSAAEAIQMSALAGASKKVASFGIYELSPPLDLDGRTAQLVAQCMLAFLAERGKIGKKTLRRSKLGKNGGEKTY